MNNEPVIFALGATRALGEAIAEHAGVVLSPLEEREFDDGEHKSRPLSSVRGRDAFVVQSLYADNDQSVNDKLVRLLFFIGCLRDAGAARVTAVLPILCYARKDQKSQPRDPVTTRYVASMFEAVGTDHVVTLDVHNLAAYQNAFRCGTDHLAAVGLFVDYFASEAIDAEIIVVAPDAGGIKRAERFRARLEARLGRAVGAGFAEKHRAHDVVSGEMMVGDMAGRTAIIYDDLIGTGTTLMRTARQCLNRGAKRVVAAATHGLFVGHADAVLADSPIERIVVTDSVPPFRLVSEVAREKLVVLDTARLLAEAIKRIHTGDSIVELLA